MPTIFILFGFRFMFYANDHEPIHVHVVKGDTGKVFFEPCFVGRKSRLKAGGAENG